MTDDAFKVHIEQLRNGSTKKIEEAYSPDFLEIRERDLSFPEPIAVLGEAYLADAMLVLRFDISTVAKIPCAICNEPTDTQIAIKGFYHAVPLSEVRGAIYNFRELLRETVLLEVPPLTECHLGKCPQRPLLEKYLKKEDAKETLKSEKDLEKYRPFADLDFDIKDK